MRIIIFAKIIKYSSPLNSLKAKMFASLQKVSISPSLLFKTWFWSKTNSAFYIFLVFVIMCSYLLSLYQRTFHNILMYDQDSVLTRIDYACYQLFISIYSVGYGDYYPSTQAGRICAIFTCFVGSFLLAMVVRVLCDWTTLKRIQRRNLQFIVGRSIA